MIDSGANTGASDPDPYVFYILNQRSDIKPAGWNIVNPLAPQPSISFPHPDTVERALDQRLPRCPSASRANMAPLLGSAARPGRPNLNVLLQFDVLLLNLQNRSFGVRLTSTEAEMLRRFVDGGGQLWVEDSGSCPRPPASTTPCFWTSSSPAAAAGAGVLPSVQRHPAAPPHH